MSAIPSSVDAGSKRWLVVLAVTATASIAVMTYSFIKTMSPPEPSLVASQKPATAATGEGVAKAEPDWTSALVAPVPQATTTRPDPFAAKYAADAKAAAANDPVAHQQAVHHQAEYLRNLISQGKLPQGYGNLTKEQVDEIEKKGLLIE